jgi:cell wall-associated NlpC family hydrolase
VLILGIVGALVGRAVPTTHHRTRAIGLGATLQAAALPGVVTDPGNGQALGSPGPRSTGGSPAAQATQAAAAGGQIAGAGGSSANGAPVRRPHVPRPKRLVQATLIARQTHRLSRAQLTALRALPEVTHVTRIGDGTAHIAGHPARVITVRPAHFRGWTPKLTAESNPLWSSIAAGELTVSFDMGHQAKLPLGKTVRVAGHRAQPTRLGAFASVGMGPVDAVVDNARARSLGLPRGNAAVISAPSANPLTLRADVAAILGHGAATNLLREVVVIRDAGEFLTRSQISTVLRAAASRIGKPYVWGATGPNSFDCSGLVQWSFAHAGITMPRVSQEQFFAGPHIPYSQARPGDLLFWHYDPTDPTDVDHVAIYAGDGKMIVAPHTGLDVMVQPVPLAHMAGVVRVDPGMAERIG